MARDFENAEIDRCRKEGIAYVPFRYANRDTCKQLLARAKYILTKHASQWTKSQQWRADIIFEFYPELRKAYDLAPYSCGTATEQGNFGTRHAHTCRA